MFHSVFECADRLRASTRQPAREQQCSTLLLTLLRQLFPKRSGRSVDGPLPPDVAAVAAGPLESAAVGRAVVSRWLWPVAADDDETES
jgi:hypothetical protein